MDKPSKIAVSFGGGVQSTAMMCMIIDGTLQVKDRDNLIVYFADTGDEPADVYRHIEKCALIMKKEGIRFEVLHRYADKKSLSNDVLNRISNGKGGISFPPLYVQRQKTAGNMPIWRGCTFDFKSRVLDKAAKKWAEVPRGYKGPDPLVTKWLGISYDEIQRAKVSTEKWYEFEYPLIDNIIRRGDCVSINKRHGLSAPRSACVYCPFHSNKEWQRIKNTEDFVQAVQFETKLHELWEEKNGFGGLKSKPYLHKSRKPIAEVNFESQQIEMYDTWDQECAGVCGV